MTTRKDDILRLFNEGFSYRKISEQLGIHKRTIWKYVQRHLKEDAPTKEKPPEKEKIAPKELSNKRANRLSKSLKEAITASQWPVINPEAVVVESVVQTSYDYNLDIIITRSASPRTYVTDILKVKPVTNYKNKRFIFTRAQNDTPVDEKLWTNLKAYAKTIGADIVIGPDTYETNWWHETNESSRNYDPLIEKYLCFGRMEIGPNMFFAGEMNILTTASTPISDLISYSTGKWCVIPHSKQQLESIPVTDPNLLCPQILTTGSITIPKVIPKKAGIKSVFHHIMGFVIGEFDEDGDIFLRHVNSEPDGSFYDLNIFVKDGVAYENDSEDHRPDYFIPGDVHRGKLDLANQKDVMAIFGFDFHLNYSKDNILNALRPKRIVLHDLHDGNIDSHYHWGDLGQSVENAAGNKFSLETEVVEDGEFLNRLSVQHPYLEEIIVDESNHDIRLEKYVRSGIYRTDGHNARFGLQLEDRYLQYREHVAKSRLLGNKPDHFCLHEFAVRRVFRELNKVTWVYDGQSRKINGVEIGHHGFRGTNGSKATLAGYVRIGGKISYADKHVPAIRDGAFQAGVVTLQQGYNKGPSSWAVSGILQYSNGSRTIITFQNGKYHLKSVSKPIFGLD